ncbi:hypothetical protein EV177_003312 [Coemansia sp. RSA 1804]|nr:hypothetical protein EV177_003312 [Coemansia sp. RSA 1804]
MVDWLNARNKELKDEIGLLKSQLNAACAETRAHANAELAARTSVVAATNERSALKRQIWELQDQCTQLRVEASKPTPCSRPHSASRPRTKSQATVAAATMTEPLQSDTTTALPIPPATSQPTPRPEPQPIFSRYYTGDTLVYPGVEMATAGAASKAAAATRATAIKVAKAIKKAAKAANEAPQPTSQPEQLPIFSRYYTGDTLVYPGVKTATAEAATKAAAAAKTATIKSAKAIKRAVKAAIKPTPLPESQPAQQLVFPRYYTGDTLVYPGVETAPATKAMAGKAASAIRKAAATAMARMHHHYQL